MNDRDEGASEALPSPPNRPPWFCRFCRGIEATIRTPSRGDPVSFPPPSKYSGQAVSRLTSSASRQSLADPA